MARLVVSSSREQIIFNEGALPSANILASYLPYRMRQNQEAYSLPDDEGIRQAAMLTLIGAHRLRKHYYRVEDRPLETWLIGPGNKQSVLQEWFRGQVPEYRLLIHRMPRPLPSDPRLSRPESIWDKVHDQIKLKRRPIPKASLTEPVYRILKELREVYTSEAPPRDVIPIVKASNHPYAHVGFSLTDLAAGLRPGLDVSATNTKSTDY